MMARRKGCTQDFLAESQKLLERVPNSKDEDIKLRTEGLSNIRKIPLGHLSDITCYDGNPNNQALVGGDGGCVNKALHMATEEEV
ncbi:uncharacterized protein TNCV_1726021 [Trichonephila clavipes]|nr:uncharacterized protein TNCV_1726021 [Trichonephila clavipes]